MEGCLLIAAVRVVMVEPAEQTCSDVYVRFFLLLQQVTTDVLSHLEQHGFMILPFWRPEVQN